MDDFKIEHFEREHGAGTFPVHRRLSVFECDRLVHALGQRLGIDEPSRETVQDHLTGRYRFHVVLEEPNAEMLRAALLTCSAELPDRVYLNWDRFQTVDEMSARDLIGHFDDIWYPASDDLDIIHPAGEWVVLVHHEGWVYLADLGARA